MKTIKRKDIVINHNMILKSPRKLDFVGTNKYDNKLFVAVDDLLNFIKGYECSLGDLPKELYELKKALSETTEQSS